MWFLLLTLLGVLTPNLALQNGLARTPPMGWLAWERFRCNIDCENDPENCISERLFRTMADLVVSEGYADVGYNLVSLDDCWMESSRDADGKLLPDKNRFPSGMKNLSDYVHNKGLKFGIYQDYGTHTCAGYPGVIEHMEQDVRQFASWEADYVKLDGCNSDPRDMDKGFAEFRKYMNETGRPMVFSCVWPLYQKNAGIKINYTAVTDICHLWRNFDDIEDSWQSLQTIIDYYGDNQQIASHAGPGHWNDPDMLNIGNFGLSYDQSKTQMALWAIMAAPLLMSVDLRTIRPEFKSILQNRNIIAVDQDPLGIQGRRIFKENGIEIWTRPISPVYQNDYSQAIAFVNRRVDGHPKRLSTTLGELGFNATIGYHVEDLYENAALGHFKPDFKFNVTVNPSGVVMLRANVQKTSQHLG